MLEEEGYNGSTESFEQNNYQATNGSDNTIQFRLNPENTLQRIEEQLRGGRYYQYIDPQTNTIKDKFQKTGDRLLNDTGVQSVMRRLRALINPTTVQGKLTAVQINNMMNHFHKRLVSDLVLGWNDYDIRSANDAKNIVDSCRNFAELFLTRTEDGFATESLNQTISHKEVINTEKPRTSFTGFMRM